MAAFSNLRRGGRPLPLLEKLCRRRGGSGLRGLWLGLRLGAAGALVLFLPMRLGFDESFGGGEWIAMDLTADLVLFVDLLVGSQLELSDSLTATHSEARQTGDSSTAATSPSIALFIDVLCCAPFELIAYATDPPNHMLQAALMLPRLVPLRRVVRWRREAGASLRELAPSVILSHAMQRVLLLLSILLSFCHLVACAWHGIAVHQRAATSWVAEDSVLRTDRSWLAAYPRSLHWVLVTVTTVGYGDIVCVTYPETAFAIVVVIVGGMVYPALLGAIATLLADAISANEKQAAHQLACCT